MSTPAQIAEATTSPRFLSAVGLVVASVLAGVLTHFVPAAAIPALAAVVVAVALLAAAQRSEAKRARVLIEQKLAAQLAAEANALTAEQRETRALAAVLDALNEGIWITDDRGVIIRHNGRLKELLFAGQDLIGQRPMTVLRSLELHDAVMRACTEGQTSSLELPIEGLRPRTLQIRVAPLQRELPGSVAVFRDATDLRRLERVRKDFVANVSHELRTPITAILGYAETLRAGALQDPTVAGQMVEIIHRQSERLSELVSDLLDLSRLDAGELALRMAVVHLDDLAKRAAEVVGPKAADKKIALLLNVDEGLCAHADERAVEQVLINLLDNAIKYTPAGGRVEVRGERRDGRCAVSVKDNGPGIEAKHLPRLFERFYRVDRGRSRDMGGTGLGLSIVKHLVTAMAGEVHVASQPGEGSTFTVTLPAS